jgi:hypothetical protein
MPREKKYKLHKIALQIGNEVVRLPPYHYQYNPIELIWSQVKDKVAEKNNTFKMTDVEVLINSAFVRANMAFSIACVYTRICFRIDSYRTYYRSTIATAFMG